MAKISFNNVTKILNDNVKIENVNIEINKAKTTAIHCSYEIAIALMQLIDAEMKPTSGQVIIADKLKLAKVFAETGYDDRLSIAEIIKFYASITGNNLNLTKVLDRFALQGQEHKRISFLEKSQKMLLGLAVAYVQNPDIIIVHEPTINWQNANPKVVKSIVDFLKSEGIGVLILTVLKDDAIWLAEDSYYFSKQGLVQFNTEEDSPKVTNNKLKIVKIPVKLDNKILLFNPFEIDYVEAFNNNTCIYVSGKAYNCNFNISELAQKLETFGFFRNHRSYLVNLQKIKEVVIWSKSSSSLVLNDAVNSTVPISKARLDNLKQIIDF